MEVSNNKEFSDAISNNLVMSPFYGHIERLLKTLDGEKVFVWGGVVRDPVINVIHGFSYQTRDFDFTIDDSRGEIDFKNLFADYGGISYSRFGTPRWKPVRGLEIDVGPFSASPIYSLPSSPPLNLENTLHHCDLTTSAIAYDLRSGTLFSAGALKAIKKKEVDILYAKSDSPEVLMTKVILHASRLGFDEGPVARKFIAEKYDSGIDENIRNYLSYKKCLQNFGLVRERLIELSDS